MGSRDKDTKSLQDKLKQYFKFKSGSASLPQQNELAVTLDLERELAEDTPIHRRLKAIRDLTEKVLTHRLQTCGVERVWCAIRDLLHVESNPEARHAALSLLRALAEGQGERLLVMRTVLYKYLRDSHPSHNTEDDLHRFRLLQALTHNGKNITCFEEEMGSLLLEWLPQIQCPTLLLDFLALLINVVKFNAAYLDEEIVSGVVNNCCYLCCYSCEASVVHQCMAVLEAVVSYSIFPQDALHSFVCALCRTVNVEQYCQNSWKIMRNVLGTELGHAALLEMVGVLSNGDEDAGLTRGAVFYINMALWGSRRVHTLKVSYLSVLPAFLAALSGGQAVVTYEVVLALQGLIARHGQELHEPAWNIVFDILHQIFTQIEGVSSPNEYVRSHLHELITAVERLHEKRLYNGAVEDLYALVDRCGHGRPECSTVKLINWRSSQIGPTHNDWLGDASRLAEKYIRQESRLEVRLHTLHTIHSIIQHYRISYEDELLERVGVPCLQQSALDSETAVRCTTANILTELASHCHTDSCTDLLDLLEKIMNRPFDMYVTEFSLANDTDTSDIRASVEGLVQVFHSKLFTLPSSHAVRVYLILLNHLELHYARPSLFQNHPDIRIKIFDFLFSARANAHCQIGFCYDESGSPVTGAASLRIKPVCSPFVCVEGGAVAAPSHSPTAQHQQNVSYVSIRRACRLVVVSLTKERDWFVLGGILREIPRIMQNKPLVLGRHHTDIDLLASTLCAMVSDKSLGLPEALRHSAGASKPSLSEFHSGVFTVLASLAPYQQHLEPQTQHKIVKCLLKYGIVLRVPQHCINALTLFTLEMRDTMVKLLPEVLLDLSKISDTKHIACPMLEFLSTLTRLPKVFASFVEDQYMSVFAILLPYTNPSRYNHYVVSLAHHVIAAWFLKCRLNYRRNFVKFIIHGLHNYIIVPFEEQLFKKSDFTLSINEDSSNRKRSSSLGSKGTPHSRNPLGGGGVARSAASASAAFHLELTETCVDLMARYTFSPCTVKPRRSATEQFLFSGGQTATWLVGHRLITVTTSGCQQNSLKQGLCDRCSVLCRQHVESMWSPNPANDQQDEISQVQEIKRQNSSEGKSAVEMNTNGNAEHISEPHTRTGRFGPVSGSGLSSGVSLSGCPCWCAGWAEVHVRSPTGDVSWVMRMQNQMNFDHLLESPLHDVCGLLAPSLAHVHQKQHQNQQPPSSPAARAPSSSASASSGIGDSRNDILSESDPRSRSGSSSSQQRWGWGGGGLTGSSGNYTGARADLHKSSSDSVVGTERRAPHAATHCILPSHTPRCHVSTEPIDIPSTPQRQSSSSTTATNTTTTTTTTADDDYDEDNDDTLHTAHEGKSRHPVRRSNSSPEMSSSWKSAFLQRAASDEPPRPPHSPQPRTAQHHHHQHQHEQQNLPPTQTQHQLRAEDMILLSSVEPTNNSIGHHHSKKSSKKADMRVSCEAIPEEICSGSGSTPPHIHAHAHAQQQQHHHPYLMTYNSDPGSVIPQQQTVTNVSTEYALDNINNKIEHNQKSVTSRTKSKASLSSERDDLPPLSRSKRANTISVMSPTRRRSSREGGASSGTGGGGVRGSNFLGGASAPGGGGVTPAFVLLQLFHNMSTPPASETPHHQQQHHNQSHQHQNHHHHGPPSPTLPGVVGAGAGGGCGCGGCCCSWAERPLRVFGERHERSIKNLDLLPPVETYKVGVLYVGPGQQDNETVILKNEFGSVRYSEFIRELGTLVELDAVESEHPGLFLNLEKGGKDGKYTYVWNDDIMQVHFHVATAMPNLDRDPTCNEKRKYIGNDYVSIVYNDSGADFIINTIKGQLNFCVVIVEPLDHGINRVTVKSKNECVRSKYLPHLCSHAQVISDRNVALLARQMALHCTLASLISVSLSVSKESAPYASNSLERLRIIKRLRSRLSAEREAERDSHAPYTYTPRAELARRAHIDDFTEYT